MSAREEAEIAISFVGAQRRMAAVIAALGWPVAIARTSDINLLRMSTVGSDEESAASVDISWRDEAPRSSGFGDAGEPISSRSSTFERAVDKSRWREMQAVAEQLRLEPEPVAKRRLVALLVRKVLVWDFNILEQIGSPLLSNACSAGRKAFSGETRPIAAWRAEYSDALAVANGCRETLLKANLRLVLATVRDDFSGRGFRPYWPDLLKEGELGLLQSVDRFWHEDDGASEPPGRLISYAKGNIKGYCKRWLSNRKDPIRRPQVAVTALGNIRRAARELHVDDQFCDPNIQPTPEALLMVAEKTGMTTAKVLAATKAAMSFVSIRPPTDDNESSAGEGIRIDHLADESGETNPDGLDHSMLRAACQSLLSLDEQLAIAILYSVGDGDELAQRKSAERRSMLSAKLERIALSSKAAAQPCKVSLQIA